jgi:hypothetical protein
MSVAGRVRFPWSKQMTTRIPSQSPQQSRGAPSLIEPQSKDDALLHTWFPGLAEEETRDFFSAQWSKTGLPLSGNYEAAKKLYDKLFRKRATSAFRPRSLSATMPSDSGCKPKPLTERAVHVPSPSTQAPAPAPDPEIYIDLTDFLVTSVIEVKAEEVLAPLETKSGMHPEDEAFCKELDTFLENLTQRFKTRKPDSRLKATPLFRKEFRAHCKKLHKIYEKRLKGTEHQNALLREHVSAHVSDFLSVLGQSENFFHLETIVTSAEELLLRYPQAAPRMEDLGRRLVENFRELVARPDGSRRNTKEDWKLLESLANVIASNVRFAQPLLTTAFQYCHVPEIEKLLKLLEEARVKRSFGHRLEGWCEDSLEQTARTIRYLSMRGSDQEAGELFMAAIQNARSCFPNYAQTGRFAYRGLKAYEALSRQAKYRALQWPYLKDHLSQALEWWLRGLEEADAVRKEIDEFDPSLFALPEVSTGGQIVTIIKKLEETFVQLPGPLADNVAALLHSHIQEFLDSASTSSESLDERGARREAVLGALNYAFTVEGSIASLADFLSAEEAFTVRSWFSGNHKNPIREAMDARLKALGARDEDLGEWIEESGYQEMKL